MAIEHNRRYAAVLTILMMLALGTAAFAGESDSDEEHDKDHIIVRNALRLEDCPEMKVLGGEGVRVFSLSPRTFLGVEASNLTPELREHFGVSTDAGVMLSKIVDESAAAGAGLAVGDIVTRVDGEEITSIGRLGSAIRDKEGGEAVEIEYWRDGEMAHATATLEARERCSFDIGDSLRAIDIEELSKLGTHGIQIGGEALESALEVLRDQDWEEHFEGLKEIDLERIEERMERVQERLERLEVRLQRDYGRELERAEQAVQRELERAERDSERSVQELERAERDRARAERDRERSEREREREREREDGEGDGLV
ncbi:MAG: PDZ domain-containing protein [bacterium]|nr:PDZ domain-containing protein [bacterium]